MFRYIGVAREWGTGEGNSPQGPRIQDWQNTKNRIESRNRKKTTFELSGLVRPKMTKMNKLNLLSGLGVLPRTPFGELTALPQTL